jgi:hypothetical protein
MKSVSVLLRPSLLLAATALCFSVASTTAAVPTVRLAASGKPLVEVVTAEQAPAAVRKTAAELARHLSRIVGAEFGVTIGDGSTGLAVGRQEDFPRLNMAVDFAPHDGTRREEYLLRSHAGGVWLIGATALACQHAVWDLLHRLGYRQYFPGETWEVVPRASELTIKVDTLEKPSYHARRIWYGFGAWDYAAEPYRDWCEKNRCVAGLEIRSGHAYDSIVAGLAPEFAAHPEYWPLLKGERKRVSNPKPCLGNPAVRRLMITTVLRRLRSEPEADSVSIDPSDGGGWCECNRCAALGSVSDQAVTLANELAEAVHRKFPGKRVGLYGYNYHSPPPTMRVHPQVVVSVATAFIKGGNSLAEILAGWSRQGATLGIREYYSVNMWDRDLPAQARGGNLDYLQRTIPEFHRLGARFMSAEASDNWGPNGLGYYLASRLLWDVREASRGDELIEDFFGRAFGPAREPMREFYRQLDGSRPHLVEDDQLGRMFRSLAQARVLASSQAVQRRVDELTLYAHYVALYRRYARSANAERQAGFETLIRHTYRMRRTMLVHSKALYRDLVRRDKTLHLPAAAAYDVPEGENQWKSSEPFAPAELLAFLHDGVGNHPLVQLDFKPVAYSGDLQPAAKVMGFPEDLPAGTWGPGRGQQVFFTYAEKAPTSLKLTVTGGLIPQYRDRGNVKIELWKIGGENPTGEQETLVTGDASVVPDGRPREVRLLLASVGLYRVSVRDGGDKTLVEWPADRSVAVRSDHALPLNDTYRQWSGYFYVPKGTTHLGFLGGDHGEIRDSEDRPLFWFNGRPANFYRVSVPAGQDGKVWRVRYMNGSLRLLNVPPYIARTPGELLLPREVIASDRP